MKIHLPSTELLGSSIIEVHYQRPHLKDLFHITCAEDAEDVLRNHINPKQIDLRECFWVILLSNANRVLGLSEVACGTSKGVQTNTKYIFQLALLTNASAIIIAHNHPSGNLTMSHRDIEETKKIKQLAEMMDVTLLDHIIITSESYVSMMKEDKL